MCHLCAYMCVYVCVFQHFSGCRTFSVVMLYSVVPPPTPPQRPSVLWERIRAWTLLSMLDLPASGNRPFVLNNSTFTSRVGGVLRGRGGGGGEHLATSGSEVRLISGSLGCFHPSSLLFEPSALPSFFFFLH